MVSKVSSILDQCRILAFPSTLFFVGERLVNHTIANINVIDRDTCEYRCYLNHNCVSVNFYFGPSEAGIQNCELNNSTKKKHDKDLTKAANYVSPGHNHFWILDDVTKMDVVVGHRGNSLITLFEHKRLSSPPISHETLQNYRRQAITHNKQRTDGGRDDEKEKFR